MADPEQFKILEKGVEAWNEWREKNPAIQPNLIEADLSETNLRNANLSKADLSEADFREADLREADLSKADLSEANLRNANLSKADLQWAVLNGADLRRTNLSEADLTKANLLEANLRKANLRNANLFGADLSEANLREADLSWTNLSNTNLRAADLHGADLSWANLSNAKVYKANLSSAKFRSTIIGNMNLNNVSGLESTIHYGPSTIGIDTIFRSAGKIPQKFLEDAGAPDIFIEYMSSLTGEAFQYYSCFISYSTNDKEFADRIYADLRKEGVRCWFAPEDIKGGMKIHRQLDEAIRIHDKILLILSEKSINSDWVANEIRWARKREKQEGKQKLFPVTLTDYEKLKNWELFDADTATDLAAEVRSYFIPDFTNWKNHNDYLTAFKRLLKDLKTEE